MATAGSTIAGAADRHVDLSDDTTRRYQAAASLFQMFDKDKDQELRGNELRVFIASNFLLPLDDPELDRMVEEQQELSRDDFITLMLEGNLADKPLQEFEETCADIGGVCGKYFEQLSLLSGPAVEGARSPTMRSSAASGDGGDGDSSSGAGGGGGAAAGGAGGGAGGGAAGAAAGGGTAPKVGWKHDGLAVSDSKTSGTAKPANRAALCLVLWKALDRDCDGVLNFDELRPFVAFNEEREPADVLDSDVRASLREFSPGQARFSINRSDFQEMMLNGNLRFESDATFKRVCAAMEAFVTNYYTVVLASASATSAATSTGDAASSGAGGGAGATTSGSSEDKLDRTGLCRLLFRELDQNGDGNLDMEEMRVLVAFNFDIEVDKVDDASVRTLIHEAYTAAAEAAGCEGDTAAAAAAKAAAADDSIVTLTEDAFVRMWVAGNLKDCSDDDFLTVITLMRNFVAKHLQSRKAAAGGD